MPRKRRLNAHLAKFNAVRKKASSAVTEQHRITSDTDESQQVHSDDDSYWPSEDEIEIVNLADDDVQALILKWVPDARPKGKSPHIGVSRWTTWRRQSE